MDDWRIIIYILNTGMQVVILTAELSLRKKTDTKFLFWGVIWSISASFVHIFLLDPKTLLQCAFHILKSLAFINISMYFTTFE